MSEPTIHDALDVIERVDANGGPPKHLAKEYYANRDLIFRYSASGKGDELGIWPIFAGMTAWAAIRWMSAAAVGLIVVGGGASTAVELVKGVQNVNESIKAILPWVIRGGGAIGLWWLMGRPGKNTIPALLGVGRPRQTKTMQTTYSDPVGDGSQY